MVVVRPAYLRGVLWLMGMVCSGVLGAFAQPPPVTGQATTDALAEPTHRIAVLPPTYMGLTDDAAYQQWAAGLAVLLHAGLEHHPQLRLFDRAKTIEIVRQTQFERFIGTNTADLPPIEGAEYVLLGTYTSASETAFRQLEIRLMTVETGAILARQHVRDLDLPIHQLPNFIAGFCKQAWAALGLDLAESLLPIYPNKSEGLGLIAQAATAHLQAIHAPHADAAQPLYQKAWALYEQSMVYFTETEWIQREMWLIRTAQERLKQTLQHQK